MQEHLLNLEEIVERLSMHTINLSNLGNRLLGACPIEADPVKNMEPKSLADEVQNKVSTIMKLIVDCNRSLDRIEKFA
jgi:hypothetical protein